MKDFVFKLIDQFTEGVDTYHNNGSMWLIFTDRKKWVIELTEDGTLWYNFHFFKDCFKYLSLDVVENQNYITEWVEDTIQNGVIHTAVIRGVQTPNVEDTIQNGVRNTDSWVGKPFVSVEYTIQNGMKETKPEYLEGDLAMEEVIQNGIKETIDQWNQNRPSVKDVVEKGVKLTNSSLQIDVSCVVENVIQNGIKETWGYSRQPQQRVNEIINGSIKETNWRKVDNHPTYLYSIINTNNCNSAFGNVLES